ncbi:MAG: hypothetical protein ACOH2H_15085 [Cypionkella sp.]
MDVLERIRMMIETSTPLQRCAIEVMTYLVKAGRNELAKEVSDLMCKAGRARGADVVFPDTDIWDRLRASVSRDEFRSWYHFLCAMVIVEDRTSALLLEEMIGRRLEG